MHLILFFILSNYSLGLGFLKSIRKEFYHEATKVIKWFALINFSRLLFLWDYILVQKLNSFVLHKLLFFFFFAFNWLLFHFLLIKIVYNKNVLCSSSKHSPKINLSMYMLNLLRIAPGPSVSDFMATRTNNNDYSKKSGWSLLSCSVIHS